MVNGFLTAMYPPPHEVKAILLVYCCKKCYPMISERIEYDAREEEQMAKDKDKDKDKKKKKKDKKKQVVG